jgi:hypothetical protein
MHLQRVGLREQVMSSCREAIRDRLRQTATLKTGPRLGNEKEAMKTLLLAWRTCSKDLRKRRQREQRQLGQWSYWVAGKREATQQRLEKDRVVSRSVSLRMEAMPDPGSGCKVAVDMDGLGSKHVLPSLDWAKPLAPYSAVQAWSSRLNSRQRESTASLASPWAHAVTSPQHSVELSHLMGSMAPQYRDILDALERRCLEDGLRAPLDFQPAGFEAPCIDTLAAAAKTVSHSV